MTSTGATLGRSPDNTLSISDPELSRRHSKIEYEEGDGKVRGSRSTRSFRRRAAGVSKDILTDHLVAGGWLQYYLCDVGSTNGTYVQLVGPYAGTYKLTLRWVGTPHTVHASRQKSSNSDL